MPDLEFTKGTDTEHEIKLTSSLVYANWRAGVAYGGQTVGIEVGTAFVGNGAKIEIKGKTANGKKLGKIKDVIKNNKFVGELEIPEDIEFDDEVYFEVKLSKNGISGESDSIPTHPAVRVTNLAWSAAEARSGETVTLTADIAGVRSGTEVTLTIYEHDQDSAHDKIVEMPAAVTDERIELDWEYEYHEDSDEIPTQSEMEQFGGQYNPPEYFFTIKLGDTEFGREQESGLLTFKDWIEVVLANEDGSPCADSDYKITLADGSEREGTLDADGRARIEDVPPGQFSVFFPELAESN